MNGHDGHFFDDFDDFDPEYNDPRNDMTDAMYDEHWQQMNRMPMVPPHGYAPLGEAGDVDDPFAEPDEETLQGWADSRNDRLQDDLMLSRMAAA
jgi:hypothetical protein